MAKKIKKCPFFQANCLKEDCELFNGTLDRCDIGLLPYNLYRLSETGKDILEAILNNEGGQSKSKKALGGLF